MVLTAEPQLPPPPRLKWGLGGVVALEMGDDLCRPYVFYSGPCLLE